MNKLIFSLIPFLSLLHSPPVQAYVGPGLGAGVIASVLGVIAGLLMLVIGVIWYPIKRLIKRRNPES